MAAYIEAKDTGFKLSAKDATIEMTDQTTDWEKWIVTTDDSGTTTLKGRSGDHGYLSVKEDGTITYVDDVDDSAKFQILPNADGTVGIKAIATGKYLGSADYTTVLVDEPAGWTIALVDAPAPAPAAAEPPPEGAADIAPEDVPVAFQGAV